jgi:hypothetical protein
MPDRRERGGNVDRGFSFVVPGTAERRREAVRIAAIGAVILALIAGGLAIGLAITGGGTGHGGSAAALRVRPVPVLAGNGPIGPAPHGGAAPSAIRPAVSAPAAPTGPGAVTPLPPSPPARIWIPSIDVSSRLARLGLLPDRSLEVPADPSVAGWWAGGASPGQRGSAVIVGHVDTKAGPAVFFHLRTLRRGDIVWVQREDGARVRFVVQRLEQVPKTRFPTKEVYAPEPYAALRLITCGGAFDGSTGHYVDNVIVFASAAR